MKNPWLKENFNKMSYENMSKKKTDNEESICFSYLDILMSYVLQIFNGLGFHWKRVLKLGRSYEYGVKFHQMSLPFQISCFSKLCLLKSKNKILNENNVRSWESVL